jgi:hypothetical protein
MKEQREGVLDSEASNEPFNTEQKWKETGRSEIVKGNPNPSYMNSF